MTGAPAGDPVPAALRQAAARAGLRLGPHHRSSRFSPGRLHRDRGLAPVLVDGDPWDAAARLVHELAITGLDGGATVAAAARSAGPSERALVGWEGGQDPRWKVYLQNEHGFRDPGTGGPGPVVHLAVKGRPGRPAAWSTYASVPAAGRAHLGTLVASVAGGLPVAGLAGALAAPAPPPGPQDVLLVREDGSARRSLDLAAPRPRRPLDAWLALAAEALDHLGVEVDEREALARAHGSAPVARVAVGTDARGAPFLTLYH